ncbi:DUF3592 domain-containing protein [Streptomyces sp. BBFR2]|uniref:DUF3592 domain-containing protein n=1 Tax=Streptomyces sp. BBFR2 TaxID=3372854 RepID=UPI0037D9B473
MEDSSGYSAPFAFVFVLILGAAFLAVGIRNIRKTRKMRRAGARAYGEVVRHGHRNGDGQRLYSPVVAWQTPDGGRHEYCPSMYKSGKGRFKVGTRVVVYYDPADPDRAALQGYDGGSAYWFFTAIGVVATGFGLYLLVEMPFGGTF